MTQFAEDIASIMNGEDQVKRLRFLFLLQRFRNVHRSWSMAFAERVARGRVE